MLQIVLDENWFKATLLFVDCRTWISFLIEIFPQVPFRNGDDRYQQHHQKHYRDSKTKTNFKHKMANDLRDDHDNSNAHHEIAAKSICLIPNCL